MVQDNCSILNVVAVNLYKLMLKRPFRKFMFWQVANDDLEHPSAALCLHLAAQ